ncbi:hypothetical protein HHK36_002496 [Tetracentron sinense]|uniref:BHLH domain-containing protein n=1 Tax=Tetracentron sinense TaxID=13715 RepID=A0A834ZMH8_TETSI|nr:hypothetical protein HHK36_002496 [Tetracentron sinense]
MNRALPETLHYLEYITGNVMGAPLKLQQQQQSQHSYLNETQFNVFSLPPQATQVQQLQDLINNDSEVRELVNQSMKSDPGLENGWPDFGKYPIPRTGFATTSSLEMDYSISRTCTSPPTVVVAERDSVLTDKMASTIGRERFRKRKADKAQNPKVVVAEDTRDKRIKGDAEEVESEVTEQNNNRETSADKSKENSMVSEVQKPDYIHVRARRGQATDSHSLAERVRREKISERMKYLQDLVPGCNKITGKAGMLDEIINYVQSLQRQVEFLSMKLAALNPRIELNMDNFFAKEMFPAFMGSFPTVGNSSEMGNSAFLQFNPMQQVVTCGLDMAINPPDMALRRTTSTSITITLQQVQPSSHWETDLQSLYNSEFLQGRSAAFPSQPFTGALEANNLKMEM